MSSSERRGTGARGHGRTGSWIIPILYAAVPLCLASCQLEDITIPLGQEVVVVQCVLTLDSETTAQYVIVERSVTGTITVPNQDSLRGPPRPPLPISGAHVVITRDDGDSILFDEIPDTLGVYKVSWTIALPFIQPGREYHLLVRTPDGRVVRGTTRVPFPPVVTGLKPDGVELNRDHDTLDVTWGGAQFSHGVYMQVRPRDVARIVRMVLFTDSAHFRIPGNLLFPLPSDTIPGTVWIPGTRETFTIAAMDTNFFSFFRTANDPFTGTGFRNTLQGGLGVFGSVAPLNRTYDVVADVDHPWEGRYQLSGSELSGIIDLFVTRDRPSPVLIGGLFRAAGGVIGPRAESTGFVDDQGNMTLVVVRDPPGEAVQQARAYLRGHFNPSGTTTGTVVDELGGPHGTFVMTRMP